MLLFCLFLCLTSICIEGAKLPQYMTQCKRNDPELNICIRDSMNQAIGKLANGDQSIHAVPISPLKVPFMEIDVNGLKINVTNFEINNLEYLEAKYVKFDFDKKTIDFTIYSNQVNLVGTYDISGKILILPINGHGPINVTFVETDFLLSMDYELVSKGGKNYIHVIKNKMPYETKRAYFKLNNLFGGDPKLGEEMNKFLDENWKEVNQEIGQGIGNGLSEVFSTLLQQIFWKLSVEDMFG